MTGQKALLDWDRENSLLLRGIGILMVLLGHAYYIPFAGAIGVAIFLIQSGYGMNCACEERGLALYWNKRLRKVWFPYCLVGLFDVLVLRVKGAVPLLCTILGLDLGQIADKTMWYISFIMLWYLVFYLVMLLVSRIPGRFLRIGMKTGLLFLASFGVYKLAQLGAWNGGAGAGSYVFAFPTGVLLSELRRVKVPGKIWSLLWLTVLFFSSAYLLRYYPFEWYSPLMTTVATAQAMAILLLCKLPGKLAGFLGWFGKYSYPIYLFEGLFLEVRMEWFARMQLNIFIDLTYILVSVACAVVFWKCYQRLEELIPWDRMIRF